MFALVAGCAAGLLPAVHSETERLELARRLAARGKWAESNELLKTYVQNNAGSADVDEVIEQLGEGYLHTKEWPLAEVEFERVLRDYPESDSSAAAAFHLGAALFGQSRPPDFDQDFTVQALEQWQRYLRGYPGHWLNAEAQQRVAIARNRLATKLVDTGRLYLKLKHAEPARLYFQRVIADFSDTPRLGDALLGLAMSEVLAGRRDRAVAQLQQLEEQFAGQPIATRAARERARLR